MLKSKNIKSLVSFAVSVVRNWRPAVCSAVNYNINIYSNGSGDLENLYRELLGGNNLGKFYIEIQGKLLVVLLLLRNGGETFSRIIFIFLLLLGGIYSCRKIVD